MGYMTSQYRRVAPARLEQRDVFRHPVLISRTTMKRHATQADEAKLINLSIYGCSLEADHIVKAGQRLWLRFSSSAPIPFTYFGYQLERDSINPNPTPVRRDWRYQARRALLLR
jgi:hypothetical protein